MSDDLHSTDVDLDGLLVVLGEHLYSTPSVAVREMVQNAHDSIVRRRMEATTSFVGHIRVAVDRERSTLTVQDDGAGLTEEQVVRHLATIGRGITGQLRAETGSDELIGMFGLGFLSAFVVADLVTVTTTSHEDPAHTWRYRSMDGRRYALEPVEPAPVGTTVELGIRPEHRWLLEPDSLAALLRRYCALLEVPVELLDGSIEAINDEPPPWRDPVGGPLGRDRRLAFAARFESTFAPLCTIDVQPSFGADAVGLLWIQDGSTYGSSDNRHLNVFVRGMLLDDDARDLLPRWAGFVGGVVESRSLTPTASREDLQRDDGYQATRELLEITLIDGFAHLAERRLEDWRRVVARHNQALLSAALCDDRLFDILADDLTVPTTGGEMTAQQLLLKGKGGVHVSAEGEVGFEAMIYRALDVPVARGDLHAVEAFLRRWCTRRGAELVLLGTADGDRELFRPATLEPGEAEWLAEVLGDDDLEVVPARFVPPSLPFVVVPDREAQLKRRIEADEADERIAGGILGLARLHTARVDDSYLARLYVNLDSPVINAVLAARAAGHPNTQAAASVLGSVRRLLTGPLDGRDAAQQQSAADALEALGSTVVDLVGRP